MSENPYDNHALKEIYISIVRKSREVQQNCEYKHLEFLRFRSKLTRLVNTSRPHCRRNMNNLGSSFRHVSLSNFRNRKRSNSNLQQRSYGERRVVIPLVDFSHLPALIEESRRNNLEEKHLLNVKVGEQAPDFCLPDKDGNEVCLKQYKGKWLILYFYPKDNTKGCTIEALDFTANLETFEGMGAVVIGVSPDSPKSHQKFVDKHNLTVLLLSDEEKAVLEKYGVWQEKSMYGKTYFGVVRSTLIIDPKGTLAEIWEKVRVKDHAEKVKQRLAELQE